MLETVGSPCDFKTQSAVCFIRHHIDAIASLTATGERTSP
jgi:hypothetical protein